MSDVTKMIDKTIKDHNVNDFSLERIHYCVEANKKRLPEYLEVTQKTWEDALDNAQEFMSHGDDPEGHWTTQTYWMALFTAAHLYCHGFHAGIEICDMKAKVFKVKK